MKILLAIGMLLISSIAVGSADETNSRRRIVYPPGKPEPAPDLLTNFQITLSSKSGDKHSEVTLVTCAPQVALSSSLEEAQGPRPFTLLGTLREEGDLLQFDYKIQLTKASASLPAKESSYAGALRMKPGKPYEVIKGGDITYTLTITPERNG